MITNTGKNILAKYLVGQTPSYASHIAIGCGVKPLSMDDNLSNQDFLNKKSLNFEMFRVPIISRGFVNEDGVSKVVLTAELPTQDRYEITEVGIYSGASNPAAGNSDSKTIYSFSDTDNWKYGSQASEIISIYEPLDDRIVTVTNAVASGTTITYTTDTPHGLTTGTQISISGILPSSFNLSNKNIVSVPTSTSFTLQSVSPVVATFASSGYLINDVETNVINQVYPVFQTNADNKTFTNSNRVIRYERCRFLNNIIAIVGNNANISKNSANHLVAESGSNYIQLSDTAIDLSKNSPTDELKFAFSIINKNGAAVTIPDKARVIIEFSSSGTFATGSWARFEAEINYNDPGVNFATNRYFVISKQIQELYKSDNFAWSDINTVRIYSSVIKDSAPTSDFYVCLDGLRLENTTSTNSVYGMTGYSVIRSTDAKTIIKSANTTNYIEFRFSLDVA